MFELFTNKQTANDLGFAVLLIIMPKMKERMRKKKKEK